MSRILLPFILAIGVMLLAFAWRELEMWRARRAQAALFSIDRDGDRLRRLADQLVAGLGVQILAADEVDTVSSLTDDPTADARAAVMLAARHFGVSAQGIEVIAGAPDARPGVAGFAQVPAATYSWSMEGDRIAFAIDELAPKAPAVIHVAPKARESAELHQLIAAHELAHHAIHGAGVAAGSPNAEEEQVDIALILAGFGGMLAESSYRQIRELAPGSIPTWRITGWAALSPGAIAYLRAYRRELTERGQSLPAA